MCILLSETLLSLSRTPFAENTLKSGFRSSRHSERKIQQKKQHRREITGVSRHITEDLPVVSINCRYTLLSYAVQKIPSSSPFYYKTYPIKTFELLSATALTKHWQSNASPSAGRACYSGLCVLRRRTSLAKIGSYKRATCLCAREREFGYGGYIVGRDAGRARAREAAGVNLSHVVQSRRRHRGELRVRPYGATD